MALQMFNIHCIDFATQIFSSQQALAHLMLAFTESVIKLSHIQYNAVCFNLMMLWLSVIVK